jgi:choline-sulfatase
MTYLERSVRVPLIVHNPRRFKPRRVSDAVSLVDLPPTLMSLAFDEVDSSVPTQLNGRSLYPHLHGDDGHDEVISEYYAVGTTTPLVMLRRNGEKTITSDDDPVQIYDVDADPEELVNLADGRVADVASAEREIAARWDTDDLTRQILMSQQRRAFVSRVMSAQGIDWDYTPRFDGSGQYIRNTMPIAELEDRSRFPRI